MSLGTATALRTMQAARDLVLRFQRDHPGALKVQHTIRQLQSAIAVLEQEDSALLTALRTIVQALPVAFATAIGAILGFTLGTRASEWLGDLLTSLW
jgi:hypothetical protein